MRRHLDRWRQWALVGALAVPVVLAVWPVPAPAAEFDCQAMADKIKTGDAYEFLIELQSQKIRLQKGDDFCSEPVEDWFQRMLILPPPAPPAEEKKKPTEVKKDAAPASASSAPSGATKALPGQKMRQGPLPDMGLESDDGGIAPITGGKRKVKTSTPQALPGQEMRQGPMPNLGLDTDTGMLPIPSESAQARAEREAAAAAAAQLPSGDTSASTDTPADPSADPSAVHVTADGVVGKKTGGADQDASGQTTPGQTTPGLEAGDAASIAGVVAPPLAEKDDSLAKRCDRDIIDFWKPGEHEIDGVKFWLAGVFTIDLDSDGRVDDVGFKIKSTGKIGNVINYFPSTEGRLSGKTIESLKLEEDRDIRRLCAANITFEEPGPEPVSKKAATPAPERKISGGIDAKINLDAAKKEPEPEPEPEPEAPMPVGKKMNMILMWASAFAFLFLLGGAVGIYFVFWRNADDEDEDDDDDEDEYEEE